MALSDYLIGGVTPTTNAPAQTPSYQQNLQDPSQMVQGTLESMLNPNSQYIQNARQRGIEYAASRGGLNSTIAAGAAERSAMEAATPLVGQALDIQRQREQVAAEDWMSGQNFNRALQGQLTMLPVTNTMNMMNAVQEYALANPALYTPEVISGYTNFFQKNMNDMLSQYFSNLNLGGQ